MRLVALTLPFRRRIRSRRGTRPHEYRQPVEVRLSPDRDRLILDVKRGPLLEVPAHVLVEALRDLSGDGVFVVGKGPGG
jgi:hypothetical protein